MEEEIRKFISDLVGEKGENGVDTERLIGLFMLGVKYGSVAHKLKLKVDTEGVYNEVKAIINAKEQEDTLSQIKKSIEYNYGRWFDSRSSITQICKSIIIRMELSEEEYLNKACELILNNDNLKNIWKKRANYIEEVKGTYSEIESDNKYINLRETQGFDKYDIDEFGPDILKYYFVSGESQIEDIEEHAFKHSDYVNGYEKSGAGDSYKKILQYLIETNGKENIMSLYGDEIKKRVPYFAAELEDRDLKNKEDIKGMVEEGYPLCFVSELLRNRKYRRSSRPI